MIVESSDFVFWIACSTFFFTNVGTFFEKRSISNKLFPIISSADNLKVFRKGSLKSIIFKSLFITIYESEILFTIFLSAIGVIFKNPNLKIDKAKQSIVIEKHIGVI